MNSLVYVGAQKEAVEATRKCILDILATKVDQATKQLALQALQNVCSVNNSTIQNCQFTVNPDSVTSVKKRL